MTVRTIDEIFRDFVTDGVPASGPFNPHKPDIRDTLKALTEGGENFPDNRVIRLNNADEGTANNIVVTASVAIPAAAYQVLYILNVTQENTGPVTVSGAINRNLVTNINQPIAPGYLIPGMAMLCIDTGTELRLLSYGDAEAIQAAAEAAAERAEDAAEAAEAAVGGLLSNFDSRAAVQVANIPLLVTYVRTAGYSVAGDGGAALYKRVASEPSHSGKAQSADGAWWEIRETAVNVKMFGAVGDGIADDTTSFTGIRDYLQTNSAYRGGVIHVPKGVYQIKAALVFTMYAPELVHNIYVKGDGQQATVLDFSGAPAGSDAITFGKGVHFGIENLSIANAKRDGLVISGGAVGTDDFTQQGCVRNIRVSLPGRHGVTLQNAFMTEMSNVWSIGAQQYGFNIAGFCTSLDINRCWALQCVEAGWSVNGVVYSTFDACGSDQNLYGYYVRNVRGVAFIGCGAESNLRDAWLLRASDSEASGIMVAAQNIYGLALTGCYGFHNGTQAAGQFANLIAAVTANNRPIEVVISGCNTEKATTNDPSMSVNGASGQIKITEQACKFDGTVFTTGNVLYEGRRFSFTPTVAGTTVAGAGTYTTRDGSYIINNGVLSYFIDAQWTGHTGTGGVSITGMPLAATKTTIGSLQTTSLAFSGSLSGQIGSGTSTLFCTYSSTGTAPAYATMAAAGRVIASGNYPVT